jgi:hypothetical protein
MRIAAISKASVQEVVNKAFLNPYLSSKKCWHFFVNIPSPEIFPASIACLYNPIPFLLEKVY